MIIVSDTSPISNLIQLGRISILPQMFGTVAIPMAVLRELRKHQDNDFQEEVESLIHGPWLQVSTASNQQLITTLQERLDEGEAEAIALAIEKNASALLIDERKGASVARAYQLVPIGVLAVLNKAKDIGLIPAIKPELDRLRDEIGFFLGEELYQRILEETGE